MLRFIVAIALLGLVGCQKEPPAAQPASFPGVKTGFEKDDEQLVHTRLLEFEVEGKDRIEVTRALVNANTELMKRVEADGRPAASKWMLDQLQGKDLAGFVKAFGTESQYEPK